MEESKPESYPACATRWDCRFAELRVLLEQRAIRLARKSEVEQEATAKERADRIRFHLLYLMGI